MNHEQLRFKLKEGTHNLIAPTRGPHQQKIEFISVSLMRVQFYFVSCMLEIDEGQRTIKGQPSQTIPD